MGYFNWVSFSNELQLQGIDKYLINPEWEKKVIEKKIENLKELKENYEQGIVDINKSIKKLQKDLEDKK